MITSMIVAAGEDNAIGKGKDMLWHLPDDFKYFKQTTQGHPVIMGRKTFESLGKPLPHRTNIVITADKNYAAAGITICHSIDEAIALAKTINLTEIFIIGGGTIYSLGLPLSDKIYLTRVHATFPEADVFFPVLDKSKWKQTQSNYHSKDGRHKYDFHFEVYEQK